MNALIEIKELTIGYHNKKANKIVHEGINAKLFSGELTCLLGPNGAGKSTLLRTLCGFQKALTGEVFIDGISLKDMSNEDLSKMISVVLTDKVNIQNITVEELVSYGRSPYTGFFGRLSKDDKKLITEALDMVGISSMKERKVQNLSDGERQKVMIAKALVQDTPVIFLDEPAAFLDLPSKLDLMLLLHRLSSETGKLIFIVTHDLDLAIQTADKIWLMANDKPLEIGVPEDLIIQDRFDGFFNSDGIFFDKKIGLFRIKNVHYKQVNVKGEVYQADLLRRALSRNGIEAVTDVKTEIFIEVISKGPFTKFIVQYSDTKREFATVEFVISCLKAI
ncbi:MAG: ABC transporter ATP-binding protein [Marinifilaceae bacterium]